MSTHRSRTRRKALLWQAGAAALVFGAAALVLLPIADLIRPTAADWDNLGGVRLANAPAGDGGSLSPDDARVIGGILNGLRPPQPVVPEDEIPPEGGDGTDPKDGSPLPPVVPIPAAPTNQRINWVYLGSAVTPRASRALIRVDQNQQFVRQGMQLDGIKLVEVHDDHIMVEKGGIQERIERATMVADSMLAPPRPGAGSAARGPQTPPAQTPPSGSAKDASLAASEAAHGRSQPTPDSMPGRLVTRIMQLTPELRAQTFQTLVSPTTSYEDKLRAVTELGFDARASLEERREAIRALGINPDDADVLRVLEDEMNGAARDLR